jgi:hypothetical protein
MLRMNLDGAMYLTWVGLMQDKADSIAAAAAALDKDGSATPPGAADQALAANRARTKVQFDAMRAQAERIRNMRIEAHVEDAGLVVTGQTELK